VEVGGITNVKVKYYEISTNTSGAGGFLKYLTLRYESMGIKQD